MSPVGGGRGAGVGVVFFSLAGAEGPHVYGAESAIREEGGCAEVQRMQTSLSESGHFSVEIGGSDGAVKWHEEVSGSWHPV